VSAKFRFIAEQVLSLISQRERWHERSQTVRTERETATLEVWGGAGAVIRHQQRRRRPRQSAGEAAGVNRQQRTKTLHLVRRQFNAHICSSTNFSREIFFLSPRIFFETHLDRDSLTSLLATGLLKVAYCTVVLQCTRNLFLLLPNQLPTQ